MFYELLPDGTIGRSTPFEKIATSLGLNLKTDKKIVYAWNGKRYFENECPEKPESVKLQERAAELHKLLEDADYWTSKRADGEYTEEEWAEKVAIRKAWREELRGIENNENSTSDNLGGV